MVSGPLYMCSYQKLYCNKVIINQNLKLKKSSIKIRKHVIKTNSNTTKSYVPFNGLHRYSPIDCQHPAGSRRDLLTLSSFLI